MKISAYQSLVSQRKDCTRCVSMGLTNPASAELCHLDSDQIGPWTRWQGDLDADIMVVGQDWGDVTSFKHQSGIDNDSRTNRLLRELLAYVGINVSAPPSFSRRSKVFLTNSVLCLKGGDCQSQVSPHWYDNCGPNFLRPQIEIVRPKVVVAMGEWAYRTLMHSFGLVPMHFREAVESTSHISLFPGTLLIPVYHCSPRILNTHRNREEQFADWNRVQFALTNKSSLMTNINSVASSPLPPRKTKTEHPSKSKTLIPKGYRESQRYKFIQQLLEHCAKRTNLFKKVSAHPYQNFVETGSVLRWQFKVLDKSACTEFWFCAKSANMNLIRFDIMKTYKEDIERSLGETLTWDYKEDRKFQCIRYICTIGGFENESDWKAIQEDLVDHLIKMESLFKDIIKQFE